MKVLFVCTGNSCRSPMAEALSTQLFHRLGLDVETASAGISVLLALPASDHAQAVMQAEYGLDISEHLTHQIVREDLVSADYVLTMTERHKNYLVLQAPDMQHKIQTLAQFAGHGGEDIADPFGGDYESYSRCAAQMNAMIESAADKLKEKLSLRLAVACDHGGLALKQAMLAHLDTRRIPYTDFGAYDPSPVDYPVYAKKVVDAVVCDGYTRGLLFCGTGIGISIAANRFSGIRAALCHDVFSAKAARLHNDANVLTMGERVIGAGAAAEVLDAFLDTPFSGDARHIRRVSQLT